MFPVGAREIRMVVNDLFIPNLEVDGCHRIIFEEHFSFVVFDDPSALTIIFSVCFESALRISVALMVFDAAAKKRTP